MEDGPDDFKGQRVIRFMNKVRTTLASQIIGSFEDIGKDVARETAKVPKDVVGQALESLSTGGKKQTKQPLAKTAEQTKTALNQLEETKDEKIKKIVARAALEELAGVKSKDQPPSVYEKIQNEIEQKKQQTVQQAKTAAWQQLPKTGSKPRQGSLVGVTKQKSGSETSRNVRGD